MRPVSPPSLSWGCRIFKGAQPTPRHCIKIVLLRVLSGCGSFCTAAITGQLFGASPGGSRRRLQFHVAVAGGERWAPPCAAAVTGRPAVTSSSSVSGSTVTDPGPALPVFLLFGTHQAFWLYKLILSRKFLKNVGIFSRYFPLCSQIE